ncbi:hypothetical protein K8W59_15150 [Nocardioides rotundus]|uniref:hypothetical protein n=1 Tax=Nocardioides rotundus TaxID=1774216 RepID=UPI001CBC6EBF|nr:hypothetical protein [Nocardioides rotundus]UAL29117.1 hypothetical protein K8W59_15150 [Nocardioides rotundus]
MGHRNKVTHSEDWWELLAPPTVVRCEGHYKSGGRCKREAIPGGNVCAHHGGAAGHVRAVAAARIGNAADDMVKRLQAWLDDPAVEMRDKVKIAQDMLDRAGLNATEKHIIGVGEIDPVEKLFRDLLADPAALAPAQPVQHVPDPQFEAYNRAALEAYGGDEDSADIVDAEVVEDSESAASTETMRTTPPPHIRRDLERLGVL